MLKWNKVFILLLCLSFTSIQAQWLEWEEVTSTNLTLSSVANSDDEEKDMEAADLNNDGYVDVISVRKEPFSASTEPPKSDLLLINVNGVLTDLTSTYAPEFISNPSHARDVYIDDLDGDGWKDVILANTFNQIPRYFRNRGNDNNGNWLGLIDETATRFPSTLDDVPLICAVKGGDINGDGFMDLYFVNYKQNATGGIAQDFLFINDGNGNFTDQAQTRLGDLRNSAFGTEVEIKDMDNDGDNDIIKVTTLYNVAPWNARGVIILYNNGNGTFTNWQNISAPVSNSPYMIEIEDFNLDGLLDVYVVDDGTDYLLTTTSINPNNNINFNRALINATSVGGFGGNVHAVDFDLDGDMDIAVADVDVDIPPCNSNRQFTLLQNLNGTLVNPYPEPQDWATNVYDFAILDLNNDGLPEFITGKCSGYDVFLSDNCDLAPSSADFDLDGISDACDPCPTNPDPNCVPDPDYPTISTDLALPRQWNELLLESIRRDLARPTVHARNLFHSSAAMWDAWAAYHQEGCTYLLDQTVNGFSCAFDDFTPPADIDAALETTISYAMYRLLSHRFSNSDQSFILQTAYDSHMQTLGYDINITSTNYQSGSPAALGNYIAQCMINYGLQDNANEQSEYGNTNYQPVNDPLVVDNPGNPTITDFNRWQPLTLEIFIDQSGNVIPGATPEFLSPEWGQVHPFGLSTNDLNIYQRDGQDYWVYHDPSGPPLLENNGGGNSNLYKWGFETVLTWSSHLDPTDGVMWDISPAGIGNTNTFPTNFASFPNFYNQLNGGTSHNGYNTNPVTGQTYAQNMVPRGDYARVIAEFWADGPDSETPPGHWFTILNEQVSEHPLFERRFQGQGSQLDENEWYIKSYFVMGGAMHDAAVTAWGIKGWYDYIRPIAAIRAMADKGQSSNPNLPSYDPQGIRLINGYIELVDIGDPLAGAGNVNVGKIKVKAWRGHEVINNVDTDEAGVGWILAENWVPYQRPSFVTPNFAGYVSGHSTFSRAAATVLSLMTGSEYFPGGMGSFTAPKDEFLVFEDGPSVDVQLQWATYQDAANESALSRIWGGIHPPADDIPGRIMGEQIGTDAFNKALSFFDDTNNNGTPDLCEALDPCAAQGGDSDGDGICNNVDCAPNNGNLPTTPGSSCNDGNPNTNNDVIQSDGCTCVGTPVSNDCNALVSGANGVITVTGLTDARVYIKIYRASDNELVTTCNNDCGNPYTYDVPDGDYLVDISTFTTNWQQICDLSETVSVGGGNPCAAQGGDSDGDGICDNVDCAPNNGNLPTTIGTSCNDGNPNTTNDVIQSDGCTCVGTPIGNPCDNQGGDSDGDGICNDVDCAPNNASLPTTVGSSCNDGNANTTNDVIQSDGCTCAGTPISGGCSAVASGANGVITVTGLTDARVYIKIYRASDNGLVTTCNNDCGNPYTYDVPDGDYLVVISTFTANWQQVCDLDLIVSVGGGNPCATQGGDSDGDGVCNNVDCAPNNANLPTTAGTSCNDGNSNTTNDVIQSDGCTCAGIPINNPCATQGGDSDGDGVCNDVDCAPNNGNLPTTIGSSCNDGNTNTTNDVIQSDGCTCAGTPTSGGCAAVVSSSNGSINISGLTDERVYVKIYRANDNSLVTTCNNDCGNPFSYNVPDGTYLVLISTFTSNWQQVCNISETVTVGNNPLGRVALSSSEDFLVYPNPAQYKVVLEMENYKDREVNIFLSDHLGRIVKELSIPQLSNTTVKMDLSGINNGAYFIFVQTKEGHRFSKKLMIVKSY